MDIAQLYIPKLAEELNKVEQHDVDISSDDEDDEPNLEDQEDWMALCHINQHFPVTTTNADTVDWAAYSQTLPPTLPPTLLRESVSWIRSCRQIADEDPTSTWHRQLPAVDITSLSPQQLLAYNIVAHHHTQLIANEQPSPLQMIVCGTAGTGKSYLISAIAHTLGNACVLTGTTGMAAFNICGSTLHSTLILPIHKSNYKDLQGSRLQQLQNKLQNKHYLIIAEMSMLGQTMFAWIDKRLKQASGQLDTPLGGYSVILFGDFAQLPPVGDTPLYATCSGKSALALHGCSIYQLFSKVVILSQIFRQAGTDAQTFKQLLLRLRNGVITQQDWHTLLERSPLHAENAAEFTDAIRLYYDKHSTATYNFDKLNSLGTPVATINAIHSSSAAASAKPDDAGGLYPIVHLAKEARVMLTTNLWQQVGLCNGAAGTVFHFLYLEGQAPPNLPAAVLVDFDEYVGPSFLEGRPKCVPIPPVTSKWQSTRGHQSRQQLPLLPRYAITIHKSQGQTLKKAVIDIGKAELSAGCTFVASKSCKMYFSNQCPSKGCRPSDVAGILPKEYKKSDYAS